MAASLVSIPTQLTQGGVVWCHNLESLGLNREVLKPCNGWSVLDNGFHNISWNRTIGSTCSHFELFATLRFDCLLHNSGASPRIWNCDTRPLFLVCAGWGLGMTLDGCRVQVKVLYFIQLLSLLNQACTSDLLLCSHPSTSLVPRPVHLLVCISSHLVLSGVAGKWQQMQGQCKWVVNDTEE